MADDMSEVGGSPNTAGKSAIAPTSAASGGSDGLGSAYESPEQEQAIKDKAAHGITITNDNLGYMGHFAGNAVTRAGHNVGHKKIGGSAIGNKGAKQGYHVLPGSASGVQGRARYGAATDMELGLRTSKQRKEEAAVQRRLRKMNDLRPQTHPIGFDEERSGNPVGVVPKSHAVSDVKMSVRHHRESIANDKKHAKEHMASVKKHEREMKAQQRRLRRK